MPDNQERYRTVGKEHKYARDRRRPLPVPTDLRYGIQVAAAAGNWKRPGRLGRLPKPIGTPVQIFAQSCARIGFGWSTEPQNYPWGQNYPDFTSIPQGTSIAHAGHPYQSQAKVRPTSGQRSVVAESEFLSE